MPLRTLTCLTAFLLAASSVPADAYVLYLDIDQDNDPNTIDDFTWERTCTVRLVLAPTEPDEEIPTVDFGLGGSCAECQGVFAYGVDHDLGDIQTWTWETHPDFVGTWELATSSGCPAPTGFHAAFHAESSRDCCLVLNEPIFFATFQAWAADPGPGCRVPPNLAVMHGQGAENVWNYIQIGEPAVEQEPCAWGGLKSIYR